MNARLILRGNRVFIDSKTVKLPDVQRLDHELSYMVQGAEFSRMFKLGKWDGRKRLLDNSSLGSPIGLKDRIKRYFEMNGYSVTIDDQRDPYSPPMKIDILPKLKAMDKIPFEHQERALQAVRENDRGIIRMGTGGGKTLTSVLLVAEYGKKSNIYVVGKDIMYQFYELFKEVFGEDQVGIVGDGHCDVRKFNIMSIWSVGVAMGLGGKSIVEDDIEKEKELGADKKEQVIKACEESEIAIIDECHGCSASTFQKLFQYIAPEKVIGLSGTPWRDDNQDLLIESVLGSYICEVGSTELIEKGRLVKPYIKFEDVPKYPEKLKKNYNLIYNKYIVENEERNELIYQNAKNLIEKGYKVLVLFKSIKHGKIIYERLSEDLKCTLLSGKDNTEKRDEAKRAIANGDIDCIVASKIFTVGVDLPQLSGLILAGGGRSSISCIQSIGRVIRRDYSNPNKKFAAVVDFLDNEPNYLRKHSKLRKKAYEIEPGFEIIWPKGKRQ